MHPDGGILHPSPPSEPYYSPSSDPTFQQFGYVPELPETPMVPPLSCYPPLYFPLGSDGYDRIHYDPPADMAQVRIEPRSPPPAPVDTGVIGEPYDPLEDFDGFIAQCFQDPQGGTVAPIEEDPGEDPMDEDQPEGEELSVGSRAVSVGGRSEVSTDTLVAIAALAIDIVIRMAAHRRNARRVPLDSDPPLNTATFMAAMNSMATAMRDSTAAIRESAAATNRAMEYVGRRNGNNRTGGDDEDF
ncbi:hypothetical protein PIB30_068147 [Stylosanthes scabra]|uniref:Uncharacterized protein n=1 Tax=Stylosanthes scabra TaxID=79078 RepID=A0ABU6QPZ0_9FABA|nr:hypothetical protein [Stylosanthes scabra]